MSVALPVHRLQMGRSPLTLCIQCCRGLVGLRRLDIHNTSIRGEGVGQHAALSCVCC